MFPWVEATKTTARFQKSLGSFITLHGKWIFLSVTTFLILVILSKKQWVMSKGRYEAPFAIIWWVGGSTESISRRRSCPFENSRNSTWLILQPCCPLQLPESWMSLTGQACTGRSIVGYQWRHRKTQLTTIWTGMLKASFPPMFTIKAIKMEESWGLFYQRLGLYGRRFYDFLGFCVYCRVPCFG